MRHPQERTALLDAIERATRAGLAAIDAEGRQIYVNPAFCAMVGYSPAELIGTRAPFPYWPAEEMHSIQAAFERTLRGEAPAGGFELRFRRKGGEVFAVRLLLSALAEPDGRQGWLASLYDVSEEPTERAQVDRELLAALVEASGEGIIVSDAEGVVRIFNTEAERQHGRTLAEVRASAWGETYGLQRLDGSPLPVEETPLFRALHGDRVEEARWRVLRPDGTVRILAGTATPIRRADGRPAGAMVVTRDVTQAEQEARERSRLLEREQASRAEAQRTLALFENILATAPVGLCFLDREMRYFRINERLSAINGVSVADTVGRTLREVVPEAAPSMEPLYRRVFETGEPLIEQELLAATPASSERRQFSVSCFPIRDPAGRVWMVGNVVRETTAEKRAEAERVALRERAVRAETLAGSQEALRLSDEILQAVPDAVVLTDLQGVITRWAGGAGRVFGYTAEQAVGRPVNFMHRDDVRESATARIIESIARTGSYAGIIPCIHGIGGREILVEVTATTWRNQAGEPLALIGVHRDVTDRIRAEREREELVRERAAKTETEASERRFRTLAESTSDIVWRTAADGLTRFDSPSWRAFTGQSLKAWLFDGWDPLHPDDRAASIAAWKEAIRARKPFQAQFRLRRHDGVYVPTTSRAAPVLDEAGNVLEWIGTNEDISGRIAQEKERERLLRSEQEARAEADAARQRMAQLDRITARLVGEIQGGEVAMQQLAQMLVPGLADWCTVYLPRPDGTIAVAAVAHQDPALTAAARAQVSKRPVRPELAWGIPRVLRTGISELVEHVNRELLEAATHDGEELEKLLAGNLRSFLAVPLKAHGKVIGALGLAHSDSGRIFNADDLALAEEIGVRAGLSFEQARLLQESQSARAEAEAGIRAKDEFLAMLGHELRNPLAPMVTALELMRLRGEGTPSRERDIIERQLRHMIRLVDDLLDVSRITRGMVELKRRKVDLADVIASAVETTRPLFQQKGQRLSVAVAGGLTCDGDPTRLAQVFSNILGNAGKYTPKGGHITISAAREGAQAVVNTEDDGEGIEPALLPRIFELFIQGPQDIDRAAGGLGIGLTIVQRLVELHGGTVSARSAGRGRGTVMTVRLPLSDGLPQAALPAEEPAKVRSPAPGLRILVVDDNVDGALLLAEAVQTLGHQATVAHNGAAALELARREQPEVVLLDIGLPVVDGYEVAKGLLELMRSAPPLLVAVTGYGQPSDLARTRAAGFAHHLVKPIDFEQLRSILAGLRVRS